MSATTTTDLATARRWFDADGAILNVYPAGTAYGGGASRSTTGPDVFCDSWQRVERKADSELRSYFPPIAGGSDKARFTPEQKAELRRQGQGLSRVFGISEREITESEPTEVERWITSARKWRERADELDERGAESLAEIARTQARNSERRAQDAAAAELRDS